MGNNIGAKGGKKDLKLIFQNNKRKKRKEIQEIKLQKEKIEREKKQKQKEAVIHLTPEVKLPEENINIESNPKELISPVIIPIENIQEKQQQTKDQKEQNEIKKEETLISQTPDLEIEENNKNIIPIPKPEKERKIEEKKERKIEEKRETKKETNIKKGKRSKEKNSTNSTEKQIETINKKKQETEDFLEQQVIKVLEQEIEEKNFQLKKMDSEIYTIQKNIESLTEEEELLLLEKEIKKLLDKMEEMKRQILSLEKTFEFKFPIEEPDNYLICLVEEYKNNRKEEIDLGKKLKENKEFKSLVDTIIEIEEKQKVVQKQLEEKKDQMELEEEQIKKLQDDMIDIEEINKKMSQMIEKGDKALEDITSKVNETIQITEKVNYITTQVNHSLLELFLLMALFKRNLSIKNSVLAATTAALALDMILKMTTPVQEKRVEKEIKMTDYKNMIENCINDTEFLENTIHQNLNKISSLRYIFEHSYQSCSYLSSYQEALDKLLKLEENMKEHKQNVMKMKQEMEYQLEKNDAKVKKYDSIKAA